MLEIVILVVLGLIMTEAYIHTKRPKLYAALNTAFGAISLVLVQTLSGGFNVTIYNSAISAILGVPGTILLYIMNTGG